MNTQDIITNAKTNQLVEARNLLVKVIEPTSKAIKKFASRAKAEAFFTDRLEDNEPEILTALSEAGVEGAEAPKPKKKAAKKATTSGEGKGKRKFSNEATIKITTEDKANPRREGTWGHASFELIKDGMTINEFLDAGGRRKDLMWDVDHGHVEITEAAG